ncbi:CLIP-associating protein 1-B-like isoform X3 [Tubulanus polymorphus]|uniref:CLIP-associating protein 1-B-like isoform X3 n=1 Tax=Tubulanus polymorphus TaxID=672921 RepID=UPI003DA5ED4A
MESLDECMPSILSQDIHKRSQSLKDIVVYLSQPNCSLQTDYGIDRFVDGISGWISSSNFKISIGGMEILVLLIKRMGPSFRHHAPNVISSIIDRTGDNKDQVREAALDTLVPIMDCIGAQVLFERVMTAFNHKLWKIREGIMLTLIIAINKYGAKSLTISKLVPSIVKCLDDQNGQVRDTAIKTLVEIYRHIGERVRTDLAKKGLSQQKLNILYKRFDEVHEAGEMVAVEASASKTDDETSSSRRPMSATRRGSNTNTAIGRRPSTSSKAVTGGVDEEAFIAAFEDVPKVQFFSGREVQEHINKVQNVLSDPKCDWEKRVESLKIFRALIVNGATNHDEFFQNLRPLEASFQAAVGDLRSQVVREACITIAYMSQQLGSKFDHFAETLTPNIISLIPNSAKIMATSGVVCFQFIIQYTHCSRLIPIITGNLTSKSNVIRKYTCDFLEQLLHTWPTHTLERHIANLQDAIKRGINDADADARAKARKAFWGFANHFKDQADSLLNSLEPAKKRMLEGEMSNSSSNNSLNSIGRAPPKSRIRSASTDRGYDISSLAARRTATRPVKQATVDSGSRTRNTSGHIMRSSSDLDLTTNQRRPITTAARVPQNSYSSLPRGKGNGVAKTPSSSQSTAHNIVSPERSRPRSKVGISQSQPSSRSGSPSSRLSYYTYGANAKNEPSQQSSSIGTSQRRRSAIPRSQGTSRETSPTRTGKQSLTGMRERRYSGSSNNSTSTGTRVLRTPRSESKGAMGQRILGLGTDAERAVADALFLKSLVGNVKKDESDDNMSETSSVCSDRSFGRSYESDDEGRRLRPLRRRSKSYIRRLVESGDPMSKEVSQITTDLTSSLWSDRRQGLHALQGMLRSGQELTPNEVRKVSVIFTRLFHDPHGKVFSLFLEVLMEFVFVYKDVLAGWIGDILPRLLVKSGADLLGSVQAKINRLLDLIRDSFPFEQLFVFVRKFIIEETVSINPKDNSVNMNSHAGEFSYLNINSVKEAILTFLHSIIIQMDPSDFVNSSENRLAVSRILTWITEPRSAQVRKGSSAVIKALFDLNSAEFSRLVSGLPKAFQDSATKILQSHMKTSSRDTDVLAPKYNTRHAGHTPSQRIKPSSRQICDEMETENMDPDEIYNSICKTSADIQNLSFNSKLDSPYDDLKKQNETSSQDSGIQSSLTDLHEAANRKKQLYNPSQYEDDLNGYNRTALDEAVFDADNEIYEDKNGKNKSPVTSSSENKKEAPIDQNDVIVDILTELSNHNERNEERKNALKVLIKVTHDGTVDDLGLWDEHFKNILLMLLETLGDNEDQIRAFTLEALKELLVSQSSRFKDYAELTILRILEAHKDTVREVVRVAEECANTISQSLPADQCLRILRPIVETADWPINHAAIKIENKVIEKMQYDDLVKLVPDIMPGLIKGCNDKESPVRKASVFCIVAVYMVIGEELRSYLSELNGSKLKLVNVYIEREQARRENRSGIVSPTSSEGHS